MMQDGFTLHSRPTPTLRVAEGIDDRLGECSRYLVREGAGIVMCQFYVSKNQVVRRQRHPPITRAQFGDRVICTRGSRRYGGTGHASRYMLGRHMLHKAYSDPPQRLLRWPSQAKPVLIHLLRRMYRQSLLCVYKS
jgi:hypothetical protein